MGITRSWSDCLQRIPSWLSQKPHLAAVAGYLPIAKQLLIAQPSLITSLDSCRRSALHFAIEYDHKEIVALLMEHARASDDKSKSLNVLFFSAVRAGHDDIVRQFLEQSPHLIGEVDPDGKSALQLAARRNHQTIVTQLLALKPHSTEVGGDYGMSLLHFAAQYGYDAIAARLLVEHPNLIDVIGRDGKNVLHFAAENGHEQIVDRLLAARPSLITQIDHIQRIALHGAVTRGHKTVVEKLLAHCPSTVDAVDCDGRSVLSLALLFGQTEIVPCLLAHKPVVNDKMLWYALHNGCEPFDQVVKSLLAYNPKLIGSVDGSSRNTVFHRVFGIRGSRGRRALFSKELMQAVWDTSSSLLEAPHKMNRDKETPFHVAVQINNEFAIELMQWSLSLDEIVSAFDKCYRKCPQSLLDQLRECLLMSLDKDVVGVVYEYLGFGEPKPQPNKRGHNQKEMTKTTHNKKPAKKKMAVDENSDDHASEDDEDEHDQGELDEGDGSEENSEDEEITHLKLKSISP